MARAGSPDLSVLSAIVTALGKLGRESLGAKTKEEGVEITLDIEGLTARKSQGDEFLSWAKKPNLKVGDEIRVRILEGSSAHDAIGRRNARETDERLERESFDWAKKRYFELKDKYEKGS